MVDTGLIGKGFGIAAIGIGAGIAFDAMNKSMRSCSSKKKKNNDDWFRFDPPMFRL